MGEEKQPESLQAKWNFDGAEYELIFGIKTLIVKNLNGWDLQNAYWNLRRLRVEMDAKLNRGKKIKELDDDGNENVKEIKETEKMEMDRLLNELGDERNLFDNSDKQDGDMSKFYLALENFYLHLCYVMKKHGVYFREGEDRTFAVLRR